MYLILKHHCRLISLAREKVLYENEFFDAADTMIHIKETLLERIDDLKGKPHTKFELPYVLTSA